MRIETFEESGVGFFATDLRMWLESRHLVCLVLKAGGPLDCHPELRVFAFSQKEYPEGPMLLSVLVYAYACGLLEAGEIERECATEPGLNYLCAGKLPRQEVLRRFRRAGRGLIQLRLAQTLEAAWRACHKRGMEMEGKFMARELAGWRKMFAREAEQRIELATREDSAVVEIKEVR